MEGRGIKRILEQNPDCSDGIEKKRKIENYLDEGEEEKNGQPSEKDGDVKFQNFSTDFAIAQSTLKWTVKNFSLLNTDCGDRIVSPLFPLKSKNDAAKLGLRLRLYPEGHSIDHKDFISLSIMLHCSENLNVQAKYAISILSSDNQQVYKVKSNGKFTNGKGCSHYRIWHKNKIFQNKKFYLPEDNLTIVCEIVVGPNSAVQDLLREIKKEACNKVALNYNFQDLFFSKKFADIIFDINGTKFKAHRCILAAISPVFWDIFVKNEGQKVITLTNILPEVFQEILRFVYTGQISELFRDVEKLSAATKAYGLSELKIMCEKIVCENLNLNANKSKLSIAQVSNENKPNTGVNTDI